MKYSLAAGSVFALSLVAARLTLESPSFYRLEAFEYGVTNSDSIAVWLALKLGQNPNTKMTYTNSYNRTKLSLPAMALAIFNRDYDTLKVLLENGSGKILDDYFKIAMMLEDDKALDLLSAAAIKRGLNVHVSVAHEQTNHSHFTLQRHFDLLLQPIPQGTNAYAQP